MDVHLEKKANKTAIIWESETGEVVTYTYEELSEKVNQLANALNKLNIRKGDRVTIYMPLVPGSRHCNASMQSNWGHS